MLVTASFPDRKKLDLDGRTKASDLRRSVNMKNRVSLVSFLSTFFLIVIGLFFTTQAVAQSSSVVVHDTTSAANGGERATQGLRDQFNSELQDKKPCVETMDDQDIRDALQDERERELLEGGDVSAALKAIAERMGSSLVVTVQAMPGPGGTTVYSGFVMDTKTGRTVARAMGSASDVANGLVEQLGSYLTDTCKPHWVGSIRLNTSISETKNETDGGAAHATWRKVKRDKSLTSISTTMIKATLLNQSGGSVGSPKARVMHRVKLTFERVENTGGETRCREPGKNPYYTNFNQQYTETMTQLGQGTDTMPVFISIENEGSYTISVNAPGGTIIGKVETSRSYSGCPSDKQQPSKEALSIPEGRFTGTSFEAKGKVDPKNKNALSGSQTTPDGKTTITWNLRLVKPKGK